MSTGVADTTSSISHPLITADALTAFYTKFCGQSIYSIAQFTRHDLFLLCHVSSCMRICVEKHGTYPLLSDKLMALVFYEPSTRTASSFHAAMLRLNGRVLPLPDMKSATSVSKGETLSDTTACLSCYVDVIVQRHPEQGAMREAMRGASCPMINAGDGIGEHPTQALLDLVTIVSERAALLSDVVATPELIEGLTITMVGDLKHGRTVHSLCLLLTHFPTVTVHLVSPPLLRMPSTYCHALSAAGISVTEHTSLVDVLAATDILYVTRIQKERFASLDEYEVLKDDFILTASMLKQLNAKSTLRILHPLPRVNEIEAAIDDDPRAAYIRQMRCGLFTRMALLSIVFGRQLPDVALQAPLNRLQP